jgi:hypothetical protein
MKLTPRQYKHLVEMMYLGHWVLYSDRIEDVPEVEETMEAVYSCAKEGGLEKWIEKNRQFNRHFPTLLMEETLLDKLADFEDDVFWDELTDRISQRDLFRKFGEKRLSKMDHDEYIVELASFEKSYSEEFERHGIDRLEINRNNLGFLTGIA